MKMEFWKHFLHMRFLNGWQPARFEWRTCVFLMAGNQHVSNMRFLRKIIRFLFIHIERLSFQKSYFDQWKTRFLLSKNIYKKCAFFKWKNQQNYAFFKLKKQHFVYKKWKFIMHFCNLCWMKNTFFINKKCEKIALFLCVSCVFSEFLENRKIFTSTKFFSHFHRGRL